MVFECNYYDGEKLRVKTKEVIHAISDYRSFYRTMKNFKTVKIRVRTKEFDNLS